MDFSITTDGGVKEAGAAAACFIETKDRRRKAVFAIARCESSLAELIAGMLGLALCLKLAQRVNIEKPSVLWTTDNKILADAVNEKLSRWKKNNWTKANGSALKAALHWKLLSQQIEACKLEAVYTSRDVKSAGVPACDRACEWVQDQADNLLRRFGEAPLGKQAELDPKTAWHFIDLRNQGICTESISEIQNALHQAVEKLCDMDSFL